MRKKAIVRRSSALNGLGRFAHGLVLGMDPTEAAKYAALDVPAEEALERPELSGLLVAAMHRRMSVELGPKALNTLADLLVTGSDRVRVQAAKIIIEKCVPDVQNLTENLNKSGDDLSALTVSELAALIDQLEGELSARATDVSSQSAQAEKAKFLNMLE